MSFPIIAYKNMITTATSITASSTDSGFPIANVYDYRGWSYWKSGTVVTGITIDIDMGTDVGQADALALVNHNITSEAGTIEIKADNSAHGSPATTVRQAAYTPTYGDVDLKLFSSPGALRYWRLTLAKGGNFTNKPYIGEIVLGLRTTLTEYMATDVDPFLRDVEASSSHSEGGQYLGSVLRGKMHRFRIGFGDAGANRTAFTSDLNTFIDGHLNLYRPFVYALDVDDSDFLRPVYIKKVDGATASRKAVGGVWSRLAFSCDVEEAHMEGATA